MTALPLAVTDLTVRLDGRELLHNISFDLAPGERLGILGGSGSGKTLTALALSGLLPRDAVVSGSVRLGDQELVGLNEAALAHVRGDLIGTVFQEPKTALNPLRKLGRQMTQSLARHYELNRSQRRDAALQLAARVGLDDPERMTRAYPHEVSGGQRQRAAIAAAISASPGLLIADEPTTALDVTIQQGILRLFADLTSDDATSLIVISHDLAMLAQVAERILVFADGRIVESASTTDLLQRPTHEITRALIAAATRSDWVI